MSDPIRQELEHRMSLWATILQAGGPTGIPPTLLRRLRVYGGAQGIWVDRTRTGSLTEDGKGVTVSLLNTGASYPDDLSEDGVLYHYPHTNRPAGRDLAEIDATKATKILGLPVFVITYPSPDSARRDVHFAWVEDWHDESRLFLVTFGDKRPLSFVEDTQEEEPFTLVEGHRAARREVTAREGQQRFKFRVFKRYGLRCAVCGMDIREVLDAAHIRPKNERGSDDPRNGLVLCAVHHRALDAGLFAVQPETLTIRCREGGPDAEALRISCATLEHLPRKPHQDALRWLWEEWAHGMAMHESASFQELEKEHQQAFKAGSPCLSKAARAKGFYRGNEYPFCLPGEHAEENLFRDIREPALAYFTQYEITWHDGQGGKPSNHLCDSQVCCVNFLFPFADKPHALAELLRPVFPTIRRVVSMEADQFVSFEWIGKDNYLREKCRTSKRTRGAKFTSVDAAIMFERVDGVRQIVLIEWKYTESYGKASTRFSSSGTDRTQIYQWLYDRDDCPLNKSELSEFSDLFYDPFDQMMRQQFLAHEMERAQEFGAQIVSVLHIAPEQNTDLTRVTSPRLRSPGASIIDVWERLVATPSRFASVSTEELFGQLPIDRLPELKGWWRYVNKRYVWLGPT